MLLEHFQDHSNGKKSKLVLYELKLPHVRLTGAKVSMDMTKATPLLAYEQYIFSLESAMAALYSRLTSSNSLLANASPINLAWSMS